MVSRFEEEKLQMSERKQPIMELLLHKLSAHDPVFLKGLPNKLSGRDKVSNFKIAHHFNFPFPGRPSLPAI